MLLSLALIFLCGLALGGIFWKLHLPQLLGMLLTGILLGPYVLNLLDSSILGISADLRQIALIIILTRAGLNLDLEDLKKVGRPAALLCFVPAAFEIAGMLLLAPRLLGISLLEAAVMGTVVAAVSPAVVVPGMLKLMGKKTFAEVLGGLVVKPKGKPTLVPASDRRPAITTTGAKQDFTDYKGEL